MADPTDLIREADAALAREAANEGGLIVDDPADLVRRLRDALRAERKDCEIFANVLDEERTYSAHLRDEVTRAKEWQGIGVAVRFAEFQEAQRWAEWFAAERDYHRTRRSIKEIAVERRLTDLVEARAALAEANATISALREREETAGHIAEVEMFKAIEANAELVKAQETIERVRALADEWGAGIGSTVAALAIRRAIEGPQS